ncbi:MAG: metal ABC transporter permease, partial [Rhodospirillaceae bacterium]|nr:metal ABC transporter permease [Rhodospirillaceae bacterium]
MDDFLVRALIAGIGIAAVAGPFGCILVWRRMAFFGGALAHSGLLGVAAGVLLGLSPMLALALFGVAAALEIAGAERQRSLPGDALVAIIAHPAR